MLPSVLDAAIVGVGLVSATLSGVAGMGGGTLLIGVFYALGMSTLEAVPLFAAVQLISNSSRTVAYLPAVHWPAAGWFALAAVPCTFLLVPRVAQVNTHAVESVLAVLILLSLLPVARRRILLPARASFVVAGALNGSLGLFVGATGLVVGRLFMRPQWSSQTLIGTLALTHMIGHGLRVLAFGVAGFSALARPGLLIALGVAVMLGTALGKWLNGKVSEAQFARLFRGLLLLLSLQLLYDGVWNLWRN